MYKSSNFYRGAWVLEVEVDDEESQAYLLTKDGKFSCSLACAEATGIADGPDGEKEIPAGIIDWAVKTATNFGY